MYFEGSPSDPVTGIGNWFVTDYYPTYMYQTAAARLLVDSWTSLNYEVKPPAYQRPPSANAMYVVEHEFGLKNPEFTDVSGNYNSFYMVRNGGSYGDQSSYFNAGRNPVIFVATKTPNNGYVQEGIVRCVRRMNVDKLELTENIVRIRGNFASTYEVGFYTSSEEGLEVKYLGSTRPSPDLPWTTELLNLSVVNNSGTKASGKIYISMKDAYKGSQEATETWQCIYLISSKRTGIQKERSAYRLLKVTIN